MGRTYTEKVVRIASVNTLIKSRKEKLKELQELGIIWIRPSGYYLFC